MHVYALRLAGIFAFWLGDVYDNKKLHTMCQFRATRRIKREALNINKCSQHHFSRHLLAASNHLPLGTCVWLFYLKGPALEGNS